MAKGRCKNECYKQGIYNLNLTKNRYIYTKIILLGFFWWIGIHFLSLVNQGYYCKTVFPYARDLSECLDIIESIKYTDIENFRSNIRTAKFGSFILKGVWIFLMLIISFFFVTRFNSWSDK